MYIYIHPLINYNNFFSSVQKANQGRNERTIPILFLLFLHHFGHGRDDILDLHDGVCFELCGVGRGDVLGGETHDRTIEVVEVSLVDHSRQRRTNA